MASTNWRKIHGGSRGGGELAAMVGHAERTHHQYSNPDIDQSRTAENWTVQTSGTPQGDTARALQRRVAQLDMEHPPKRIKADRVIAVSYVIPAPEGLPERLERRFFKLAYEELQTTCGGAANLGRGSVHVDEKHAYIDPQGVTRVSRAHMHAVGVAWTPEHGVNGKHFMARARIQDLNRRIDARCRRELGIPFLDGDWNGKSTPTGRLKQQSAQAELRALEGQLEQTLADLQGAQSQLDATQDALATVREREEKQRDVAQTVRWMQTHTVPHRHRDGTVERMTVWDSIRRTQAREQELSQKRDRDAPER